LEAISKQIKRIIPIISVAFLSMLLLSSCDICPDTKEAKKPKEEKAVLVLAVDSIFPPESYYEEETFKGTVIDIAGKVADELGKELEIQEVVHDELINAVATGKADIAAGGLLETEEALEKVDFSNSYLTTSLCALIRDTPDNTIVSAETLYGKRFAVQRGSTGEGYAENISSAVKKLTGLDKVMEALINNNVEAVLIDKPSAQYYASHNPGLKIVVEELVTENYAFAVAKGESKLLETINEIIKKSR